MPDTEIPLARPVPLSVDAIGALVGAVLAGSGISLVLGFAWGLPFEVALVFIAVGLPMLFVQRRLAYHLEDRILHVDVLTGGRALDLSEVTHACIVDGWLIGASLPAYHTGPSYLSGEGLVRAYASRIRGPYVLLKRSGDRPWLLSPNEPEAFIERIR